MLRVPVFMTGFKIPIRYSTYTIYLSHINNLCFAKAFNPLKVLQIHRPILVSESDPITARVLSAYWDAPPLRGVGAVLIFHT